MKIDPKSLIAGAVLGICALLTISAASNSTSGSGKYQIIAFVDSSGKPNGMIINTETGKVWACNLNKDWPDNGTTFFTPKE